MNTTGTKVKNGSPSSRAKGSMVSPAMKTHTAGMSSHDEDNKKTTPFEKTDSTRAAKDSCGGVDAEGKPQHMTPCTCADQGAGQRATDKMSDKAGARKVQEGSVDYAAASMSARDGATVPASPRESARDSNE